jgi:hypothetical protein
MTLSRKLSIATAGAATILSALSVPVSAFTITQPQGAAHDLSDPLGRLDGLFIYGETSGTVTLNPASVGYLQPPAPGSKFLTTFATDANTWFPGWTARPGAPLSGILTINEYDARDYVTEPGQGDVPRGGGDMNATYTRANLDPKISDLRFIQMYTENHDNIVIRSHIDSHKKNLMLNGMLPWYGPKADYTTDSIATTMTFIDNSSLPVVSIPYNASLHFEAYLATFDNETQVATIHDGWSWGYDIKAVPEPATIIGSAMGLGFGAFFKRKVSRNRKKS